MLLAAVIGFLFGFVGSMPVAGPIAVLVFSHGVQGRFKSGLYIALGGALAEAVYAFLAFFGFAALLARHGFIVPLSRALAAVILLVLGIVLLRPSRADDATARRERAGSSFLVGFSITALNPTLIATWTGAVTTIFSAGLVSFDTLMAVPFALGALVGIALWFALLLGLLRRYRERFSRRMLDGVVRVMGGVILAFSAGFMVLFVLYFV